MSGLLDSASTRDDVVAALQSRDIDPEDLWVAAERFPDLRPAVAAHPAASSALLDWLASTGDATIALIVGNRSRTATSSAGATSAPAPEPPSPRPIGQGAGASESGTDEQLGRLSGTREQPHGLPPHDGQPLVATTRQGDESKLLLEESPRRGVRPLNIALAVFVLALAGALVFLLLSMGGDSTPDPGTSSSSSNPSEQPSQAPRPSPAWTTEPDGTILPEGLFLDEMWGVVEAGVPVYRGPGASYPSLVTAHHYSAVQLLGYMPGIADFSYVYYLGRNEVNRETEDFYGWVETQLVKMPEKPLVWPEHRYGGGFFVQVVPKAGLNLRAGPGTNYDAIALIPQGDAVEPVGCSGNARDHGWGFVRYGAQEGWVATDYLANYDNFCG